MPNINDRKNPAEPYCLLKLQLGPVQEFIAQARSTRDLWSGSYLLSWLMGKAMAQLLMEANTQLIFPASEMQPLITFHKSGNATDPQLLLTPNLPNIFVARVPAARAVEIAREVEKSIQAEWKAICMSVWERHKDFGIKDAQRPHFESQADRLLSVAWQVTPETGNYAEDYRQNGGQLDAVRQTRDFRAWGPGATLCGVEKDSLTGKEEAIAGGKTTAAVISEYKSLFKHDDYLGAIGLIKRVWHLTYLHDKKKLKTSATDFKIRSIPAIAARQNKHDDDENPQERTLGEKYIAAIAFDGDQIGKWVSGELLSSSNDLQAHHQRFSQCLGTFALQKVRAIVEAPAGGRAPGGQPISIPLGQLIYAGGDDVLALVPADAALSVAQALRQAFREATADLKGQSGQSPDASAGIAIAHIRSPLQDLIRTAQAAEKRAKSEVGRPAFSVTLMKRSGEIVEWGSQWDSGGVELYQAITRQLDAGTLSRKFPQRVCELLEPYRTASTGIMRQTNAINEAAVAQDLIVREIQFAGERQSTPESKERNLPELTAAVETYIKGVLDGRKKRESSGGSAPLPIIQELLVALIGLCQTVAFTHRLSSEAKSGQPVSVTPSGSLADQHTE